MFPALPRRSRPPRRMPTPRPDPPPRLHHDVAGRTSTPGTPAGWARRGVATNVRWVTRIRAPGGQPLETKQIRTSGAGLQGFDPVSPIRRSRCTRVDSAPALPLDDPPRGVQTESNLS